MLDTNVFNSNEFCQINNILQFDISFYVLSTLGTYVCWFYNLKKYIFMNIERHA